MNCSRLGVVPLPASCELRNETNLALPASFRIVAPVAAGPLLQAAIDRTHVDLQPSLRVARDLAEPHFQDGNFIGLIQPSPLPEEFLPDLRISVGSIDEGFKQLDSIETYHLELSADSAVLTAPTVWGVLYGLETFSQLLHKALADSSSFARILSAPIVIDDRPRFQWRGLLLDTCNHYIPVRMIKQTVDGLAWNKMNVLHWHLVDSYSFALQVPAYPLLSEKGAWAPDAVYTVQQVSDVIEYARLRGVRVVAELETPGHAFSWGVGYPELVLQCPGISSEIGFVNSVPLDPTREDTYEVVGAVLKQLAAQFPDGFLHAGGDELQTDCWAASETVQAFIKAQNMSNVQDVYSYYETRLFELLRAAKKRAIVWEEAFAALPSVMKAHPGTVVEVWNDHSVMERALRAGHDVLLADGWYLDRQAPVQNETTWFWGDTWEQMWSVSLDAHDARGASDRANATGRVLGGEACMWSEQVSALNMHARIWPRAVGVAERLWSPRIDNADYADNTSATVGSAAERLSVWRCRLASRGLPVGPVWADYCPFDNAVQVAQSDVSAPSQSVAAAATLTLFGLLALYACFTRLVRWLQRPVRPAVGKRRADPDAAQPLLWPTTPVRGEAAEGGEDGRTRQPDQAASHTQKQTLFPQRVTSVDVCRGLTVALMIFVDNVGSTWPTLDHTPWDGIALADFVMPAFDVLVGVSVALAYKNVTAATRTAAMCKAWWRCLRIFALGVMVQGGQAFLQYDLARLRVMGILQRVALCFATAALCEIVLPRPGSEHGTTVFRQPLPVSASTSASTSSSIIASVSSTADLSLLGLLSRYRYQTVVSLLLISAHTSILYGLDVPGCGRGVLTPMCNAAGYVDQQWFGVAHMYFPTNGGNSDNDVTFQRLPECSYCAPGKCLRTDAPAWCTQQPFDPEGLVSSLTCVVASISGLHIGHILSRMQRPARRLVHLLGFSFLQLLAGLVLTLWVPLNTDLYSVSFLLVTNAAAGLLLSALYALEVSGSGLARAVSLVCSPFQWLGSNAIVIFLLAEGDILDTALTWVWWDRKEQNLANLLFPTGVYWGADPTSVMGWTLAYIAVWAAVAGVLAHKRIFIKV